MARKTDTRSSYYGEPRKFDPTFRGPVHNRSCTDVVCCVVFIAFIIGYIALGTVAWIHGDPRKVVYPTDSRGQFCGQQNTPNANKAKLFYFNMLKCANPAVLINLQCPTTQLCVSKCPDSFSTLLDAWGTNKWEYYKQFCKPGFEISSKVSFVVVVISLSVIEAVIVIILIFLRRRLRIAIALMKEGSKYVMNKNLWPSTYVMSTLFYPIITFLLLAICITYWAVTAVFLASSGNAVYKVTPADDKCMYANLTCSPNTFSETNITKVCPGAQCMFAFYGGETVYHRYILVLHLCNLFMFLWLVNFTIALGQCTLAGAFASYYWALKKPDDIPVSPLYSSFSRAIRYHTGSLAFGSLILAVVQTIRMVLEYVNTKLKGSENACARFLLCCLQCCFWCLENFIRFMNRNAYIMIAIYGKNFCTSSKDAFFLLMRNIIRVAVLDKVTDFLLFLGKLLISGSVGVLAFFFFTRKIPVIQEEVPSLNYYWVPLVTVIFGSYMIAHGFFNVYAMCVDTLFLCFCEDLERNDGSSFRPYYMSPGLHKILRKGEESSKSCAAS
ncbi:LOW QUALITY PROTEIN: choline transporter-like protein 5-B [Notothenia coriiceps]|uniref:Choline transporter-like protein n=1 Tax=Notothenia coriiceps TaxID=8208 RepID=A0A6I9Q4D0_9TELE|nr:PREDICTED: LOW QUALITY PROTEIN: choline transporter-like protein 5 [Notothenia coriiceps]